MSGSTIAILLMLLSGLLLGAALTYLGMAGSKWKKEQVDVVKLAYAQLLDDLAAANEQKEVQEVQRLSELCQRLRDQLPTDEFRDLPVRPASAETASQA